ncbi:MAG: diacylglycerol kinase [Deltaproteobacteria bacterium]|jgi:diacylglycerol kinase (ATP)|nr:diacylglycerol kinase [Deltaproteobacteria bacterium]
MLKAIKNIPRRAKRAMGFSIRGLYAAFSKEEAIKLELVSLIILLIILFFVPWPFWKKVVLVIAFLGIPLTELINSALEDICDLVSPEFNEKVRDAKDKGSAAVLVAIILGILVLVGLIALPF